MDIWDKRFSDSNTIIAEENDTIVGFANMDNNGYVDMLYVHIDFLRKSIATELLSELKKSAKQYGIVCFDNFASINAKPFFEKMGYQVEYENTVVINEVKLTNYKMKKHEVN